MWVWVCVRARARVCVCVCVRVCACLLAFFDSVWRPVCKLSSEQLEIEGDVAVAKSSSSFDQPASCCLQSAALNITNQYVNVLHLQMPLLLQLDT